MCRVHPLLKKEWGFPSSEMGKQGRGGTRIKREKRKDADQATTILGGTVVVMALLALYGWSGMEANDLIAQLSVSRTDELKEVLYSGQPWMIMCDARPVSDLFGGGR